MSPDPRLSELNEELRRIIRWMLGEDGEFPPPPDYFFERRKPPSHGWRKELRKRFDAAVDAAVLLGGTPQPQELCDVCERPLGPADTICCSHCGTKWAEPFPGRAACGGAASSPTPELALFTSSEWDLIGFILGEAVYEDEDAGRDADAQMIRDLSRRAESAALTRKAEIASSEPAAPVRPVQEKP